jgi:hypothetical protein
MRTARARKLGAFTNITSLQTTSPTRVHTIDGTRLVDWQIFQQSVAGSSGLTVSSRALCAAGIFRLAMSKGGSAVCCDPECGECRGVGCSNRPGGRNRCCPPVIVKSARSCKRPDDVACLVPPTAEVASCLVGIVGSQDVTKVCCNSSCGVCGGFGCADRPGGRSVCCAADIIKAGYVCRNSLATGCTVPMVHASLDRQVGSDGHLHQAEAPFNASVRLCATGVIEAGAPASARVCCDPECGTCGGMGCSTRPGGSRRCCPLGIMKWDRACRSPTDVACMVPPQAELAFCASGLVGSLDSKQVCCSRSCGACGGLGCSHRPGGSNACCASSIVEEGIECTVANAVGCILPMRHTRQQLENRSNFLNAMANARVGETRCGGEGCGTLR